MGCCLASQFEVSSNIGCKSSQAASFGRLDKGKLGIWEALQLVDGSHRQRAGHAHLVDDQRVSAVEHAMQTAELCRRASPQQDWFHLVGLIHGLGRLMALPRYIALQCCLQSHDVARGLFRSLCLCFESNILSYRLL